MGKLNVILDVSGSMYEMGKPCVVGFVLSTLEFLPEEILSGAEIQKIGWNGEAERLQEILGESGGEPVLLLTDGYALCDNCARSKDVRNLLLERKDSLFVVKCGADSIDVSAIKEFHGIRSVDSSDILLAAETLFERPETSAASGGSVSDGEEEGW